MVKRGGFTLEIINAETNEPFKEHTCPTTGKTYVEVEPDAEYFMQLSHDRNAMLIGRCAIDGENLGYQISLFAKGPHKGGLWRQVGGKTTMTALKFSKTSSLHQNSAEQTRPLPWTGIIKASYYDAINPSFNYGRLPDHKSTWSGGDVGCARGDGSGLVGKKGVKSQSGNIIDVKKLPASNISYVQYRPGRCLETIEVQYCTAPGLIQAGILPKPPMWDCHQKSFSRKRSAAEIPIVTPQKIKREASVIDGHTVMQAKEYELFDLSGTPDSDSDGEN
jgi:hypothetical protein